MGRRASELIPYSAVATLRNNLTSSFLDDFGRIYGVADELEKIKCSIESIESTLLAGEGIEGGGETVQQWIRTLKHVLLPADDFFDHLNLHLHLLPPNRLRDKVRIFFSSLSRFRIARQIKKMQKDLHDIAQDMLHLNLNLSPAESEIESAQRRVTTTNSNSLGSDYIIGRDYQIRKCFLIRDLMMQVQPQPQPPLQNENVNVSWIALFGLGGIGKTVLAQMLFNDEQLQGFFEKRMWVRVSHNFDVSRILQQLTGDKIIDDQQSLQDSLNKLRASLNGTRYLLVLDDVWDESLPENWTQFKSCLMCGAQGSKILVTTRSQIVAQIMGVHFSFHLKALTDEESWSLLKMLSFSDDDLEDYDYLLKGTLEWVGQLIAKRCSGVPLAIRTAAGVLRDKDEQSEWIRALNGNLWSMGEENDSIMFTLRSSYQHLSPRLKECFAYCSLYPKGWEIEKNELVQLWMAQGYLQCSNAEQQMEDVGNEFVNTLLKKSFFQDEKFDDNGNLSSFKMHELMYDLALLVADNDFHHLDSDRTVDTPLHICFSQEYKYNNVDLSSNSLNASRLRTFYLQRKTNGEITYMWGELYVILSFKSLRVLNLSRSSLKKLPDLVGRLQHLRHLDLSWCIELASLPKCIASLVNLQTLKLTGCWALQFSTESVTKLINLRHLEIQGCKAFEDMMPAGLGKMSSLQSLSSFYVVDGQKQKAGKLNELQNLNNLRGNLEISALDHVRDVMLESQDVNLKDKKLLESLVLNWMNLDKIGDSLQLLENLRPNQHLKKLRVRWYPGERFSNWLSSIQQLSYISLEGFNNCKYLPPLEELPYLKSLVICCMKVLEYIHVSPTAATFFRSLEVLRFAVCAKLRGWKGMEDNVSLPPFPRLSQLEIHNCPKLTCLPTFPHVELLELCKTRVKPLRETLDILSSSSFSTAPFSMLKSLKIQDKILDIHYLPSQLQRNLTSLEYLEIGYVDKLETWVEEGFPSLKKIFIYTSKTKVLPEKLCDSLSLEEIKIQGCHDLASLPQGMSRLTKLVTLEIFDCPLLIGRCFRNIGADWHKISHVQNIILNRQKEM